MLVSAELIEKEIEACLSFGGGKNKTNPVNQLHGFIQRTDAWLDKVQTKSAQSGFLGQVPHRDDRGPGLSHELILIREVTTTSQQIDYYMFSTSNIIFIFSANCMTTLYPHLESDLVSDWSYFTITSPRQRFVKCYNLWMLLTTRYQKWLEKEKWNGHGMTESLMIHDAMQRKVSEDTSKSRIFLPVEDQLSETFHVLYPAEFSRRQAAKFFSCNRGFISSNQTSSSFFQVLD